MDVPETLLGLVKYYSPSGDEGCAVNFLINRMKLLGFTQAYTDDVGNAIGIMGTGRRQIILLGHIDTVPGEIPIREENGCLFGRGTVDAKGPLSAFVDAVAAIGTQENWQIIVIGAVGEEKDSRGARHLTSHFRPEMAIIGEPSHWDRITLGYKGCVIVDISITTPKSHSAANQENACEKAVKVWCSIQDWANQFNVDKEKIFDQISPTLLRINSSENHFECRTVLRISARLPLSLTPDKWYLELNKLYPEHELNPIGFSIPAYRVEKSNPLVRAFLYGIRQLAGKPGFVLKTGTADINIVAPAWQCPAIAYGPGDSSLDHTPNEHLDIMEYKKSVEVLKTTLCRIILD
jgi:LysW-gamma-L-lysine carboxypeptidase